MTSCTTALGLLLALAGSATADLSWDYIDKRQNKSRKVIEQAKKDIEKVNSSQSPEAAAAYAKLGQALNTHPQMATVNAAETTARVNLQKAQQSGDSAQIAAAQKAVSQAAMTRFQKAASIPELAKLITAWQVTQGKADASSASQSQSPEVEKNMGQIEVGLDDLFE